MLALVTASLVSLEGNSVQCVSKVSFISGETAWSKITFRNYALCKFSGSKSTTTPTLVNLG